MLTQKILKEKLNYNPNTGVFTWKISSSARVKIGDECGSFDITTGYIRIGINCKHYQSHRLAFLYMTGSIPEFIDHIDGNRSNNKWLNLRTATRLENSFNRKVQKNKKGKYKGVYFKKHNKNNPWCVAIGLNDKQIHLGYFETEEVAALAYNEAAIKYFGEYAKLNIIKDEK